MATNKKSKRPDVVQVKNPRTGHYVKIDRSKGTIIAHKRSEGPYKGVPVARPRPRSVGSVRSGLGDLAEGAEERLAGLGESS